VNVRGERRIIEKRFRGAGRGGDDVAAGDRFVVFEYCISLIVVTLRRPSRVYLIRAGKTGLLAGFPYTILSLLLGWWGIPWGLIYTPLVVLTNLSGGRDVTSDVLSMRS